MVSTLLTPHIYAGGDGLPFSKAKSEIDTSHKLPDLSTAHCNNHHFIFTSFDMTARPELSRAVSITKTAAVVSPDVNKHSSQARLLSTSAYSNTKLTSLPRDDSPVRSRSIPIEASGSGMKRTPSELQLCQDEQLADYRDFVMFSRIYQGISARQKSSHGLHARTTNERCLAHIVDLRNDVSTDLVFSNTYSFQNRIPEEEDDEIFTMDM